MNRLRTLLTKIELFIKRHPAWCVVGFLLLAVGILLIRRPETIFHAQFWGEDGTYWYADAYNVGWQSLLDTYASYSVITYRLIGLVSLILPFHLAPAFFNVVALGIQLLPVFLLCSGRFKKIIPYRSLGFLIALVYIAIPNSAEIFTNLTNIQWHLGVAAFLVLLAAPRKQWWWQTFDIGVIIANGLSGPLVIILLPIVILQWWRDRSSPTHRRNLVLFGVLAAVQLISIFMVSGDPRIGAQPNASLMGFITMLTGQVFMGGLLGQTNVSLLYDHNLPLIACFIVGVGLTLYAVIKGPLWLKLANWFSVMVIASSLLALRRATDFNTWVDVAQPGKAQRYWYIPIVIWLATLTWLALVSKNKVLRTAAAGLLALLVLVGIPQDWRVKPLPYLDFRARAIQFENALPGTVTTIPLNPVGGWEMTLIKK